VQAEGLHGTQRLHLDASRVHPVRLALLALLAAGCAHAPARPTAWTVTGGTPEEQAQALAIVQAAVRLYPSLPPQEVHLLPAIDRPCGYRLPEPDGVYHYAGCVASGVWVLWPHPRCHPDLTCSALSHELCHLALNVWGNDKESQGRVDACALLITQEYRRAI